MSDPVTFHRQDVGGTGSGRGEKADRRANRGRRARRGAASDRGGRGLTTRGRCLVAGGIAAVLCAFVLDERDLLRVGVVAAALPLVAVAVTAARRTQLGAVHQVAPQRLRPGTDGQAVLVITNAGPTRTPSIEISEPAVPGLTTGLRYLIAPIGSGESANIFYPVRARHRGRFTVGPPGVRIGDPFALWEDNRTLDARAEVLVVPNVVELTGMPGSSGARSAASGRSAVGTVGGDPDIGVRQYRNGDDIRTVHWRASARHDELMVRLEEPVSHGGATVLLDARSVTHSGAGPTASLETAVVLAASICLHLLSSDHQVKLVTHRGTVLAQGHDISDDVLAGLAMLEPDPVPTLRAAALGVQGLLIAILGEMTIADASAMAAVKSGSANAVALVLATREWAGTDQAHAESPSRNGHARDNGSAASDALSATVSTLRAANWRVVVVHPNDDLAAAWRLACSPGHGYFAPSEPPHLADRRSA